MVGVDEYEIDRAVLKSAGGLSRVSNDYFELIEARGICSENPQELRVQSSELTVMA